MADTSFLKFPSPVDPFSQPVTILMPDGSPFNVTMDELTWFHFSGVRWGINYGASVGATAVTLVALILLTKPDKRRSPIFVLNLLALVFNLVRTVLGALYSTSPFQNPYAVIANDWRYITGSDKANSIAVPVMKVLLLVCIELSLLLQIHVVMATRTRTQRLAVLFTCSTVGLLAVGFSFAVMVVNARMIMNLQSGWGESFQDMVHGSNITIIISLSLFTAVFVGKLGFAMWQRRRLGMNKFGPMQVVFIMGIQTMIVPTVIALLQYVTDVPELVTVYLTLVGISLPLSALWAAAVIEENRSPAFSGKPVVAKYGFASSTTSRDDRRKGSSKSAGISMNDSLTTSRVCEGLDTGDKIGGEFSTSRTFNVASNQP